MKQQGAIAACVVLLCAFLAAAQSGGTAEDPISGNWGAQGKTFFELKFDGKRDVSGTTIWRKGPNQETRSAIKTGTFDPKTGALTLTGEARRPDNGEVVQFVIDGKLDKDALTGSYRFANDKGEFRFTKMDSRQ
jgi:uncharacterized protein (DUF2147 family)